MLCLSLTLPMLLSDQITILSACRNHFSMNRPLVNRSILIFVHGLTHRVGSETQTVDYSIGHPQAAAIHPLKLQFLIDQFLLILKTLRLGPLGPKFLIVHSASSSFLVTFSF